jgi:hypothetical protein
VPIANGGTGQTTKAPAFNALNPMTTTGDLIYESATNTASRLPIGSTNQVLTVVSGAPAWAAAGGGSSVVNGFINGFTLSNDGTTPNSVLDEAAGYAADSTNAVMITGTAFKKSTAGTWAAGSGSNGMGTGLTIAASTWYHVFAIINAGSYDVYFDTSPTAANKPASTTAFRYIGSFLTNGSSQIVTFIQFGQKFIWLSPPSDLSAGSAGSVTPVTISAPLGIVTNPIMNVSFSGTATGASALVRSTYASGNGDCSLNAIVASMVSYNQCTVTTNSSSQINYQTFGTGPSLSISTIGYMNPRVAPNF